MVDGVAERPLLLVGGERPLLLVGGERAESPTQFHDMLLFLVSRFHLTGILEVKKTGLNIDFFSGFRRRGGLGLSLRC